MKNTDCRDFADYLIDQLPHLHFAYATKNEMREHFLSGEVTIKASDAIKFANEWGEYIQINDVMDNNDVILPQMT